MKNNEQGKGRTNRIGPITTKEIGQITEEVQHELQRLRTAGVCLNVLSISEIEMDGRSKFKSAMDELRRGVDNLIHSAKNHIPRTA